MQEYLHETGDHSSLSASELIELILAEACLKYSVT